MQRLSIVVLAALAAVLSIAALGVAWGAASKVGRAAQGSPVPTTVAYQGFLTDVKGNPVPNGARTVTFRLYSGATGGSALWQETQTITTDRGVFNALLGSGTAFGDVFDTAPLHLGVQIAGEPELRPRQQLSATPFALRAADADALGGRPASAFVSGATGTNGVEASVADGSLSLGLRENYRLPQGCLPGKVAKWVFTGLSTMGWACGADIAGGDVDTSTFQQRIAGRCAIGSAMRGVDADGTPVCFDPTTSLQRRIVVRCPTGRAMRGADADGTPVCFDPLADLPLPRIRTRIVQEDWQHPPRTAVAIVSLRPECAFDEELTGGGYRALPDFSGPLVVQSYGSNNRWTVRAHTGPSEQLTAYAVCMKLVQP